MLLAMIEVIAEGHSMSLGPGLHLHPQVSLPSVSTLHSPLLQSEISIKF